MTGFVPFRHASGYKINPTFCCQPRTFFPGVSSLWFRVLREVFVLVGTTEHFGQDCQVGSLQLRAEKNFCCLSDVTGLFLIYVCLKNCCFYNCHTTTSFLCSYTKIAPPHHPGETIFIFILRSWQPYVRSTVCISCRFRMGMDHSGILYLLFAEPVSSGLRCHLCLCRLP